MQFSQLQVVCSEDGFLVRDDSESVPPGYPLRIRYLADATWHQFTVPFEALRVIDGTRQLFVFTGATPSQVELLDGFLRYDARGILYAPEASGPQLFARQLALRSWFAQTLPLSQVATNLAELRDCLRNASKPVYLIHNGAWLTRPFPVIPPSATGRPLIATGKCPGNPNRLSKCLYLEPFAAQGLAENLSEFNFEMAVAVLEQDRRFRSIHIPGLDYGFDPNLRILQLVTGLQTGGAERVVVDLARQFVREKHKVWICTLNHSLRQWFPSPAPLLDLASVAGDPTRLAAQVKLLVQHYGIDIVHGHLLTGQRTSALVKARVPLVVTLHNMPQAFPVESVAELSAHKPDLLIACSNAVEEAGSKLLPVPIRTAWNSIDPWTFLPTPQNLRAAREWREQSGWQNDLVVITVANPRPQKNLPRMPRILAQLKKLLVAQNDARAIQFILIGHATEPDSLACLELLRKACKRCKIPLSVITLNNPALYLHASDVYLSTSHFEGLSIAQLEALGSGLPVVTTDVGASQEILRELPEKSIFRAISKNKSDSVFAQAILTCVSESKTRARISHLPYPFRLANAGARNRSLYFTALAMRSAAAREKEGIWLVTDNFVMGGAQSSARRLLGAFHDAGIPVHAFTVREKETTLGTQALRDSGISVTSFPREMDAKGVAARLLDRAVFHPPQAILFWNLVWQYKIAIADAMADIARIIDVSPGEMYFKELENYFGKANWELPYRAPEQYGRRLHRFVVKFEKEAEVARRTIGASVEVIRNGVPLPEKIAASPSTAITTSFGNVGKPVVFGTAARIAPDKRLEDLLESFSLVYKRLPGCQLRIAGRVEEGAQRYEQLLRKAAKRLPVVWLGELPHTRDFLRELDIFVMISEPAGCPNALLEALSFGVPCIATDVGGASEQIIDGKTGLLTPRRDNPALADAMLHLANSKKLQSQFQKSGPGHIEQNFSMPAMFEKYRALCLD